LDLRFQPAKPGGRTPALTRSELEAAAGKTVRDVIAPGLRVLFCGINPGLYSGATGHHFARPGNRFWRALHLAGFTERTLSPSDERELLWHGFGITNLVRRTTAKASELDTAELIAGAKSLERKVRRYRPNFVAILGVDAYRKAFARPTATLGRQRETLADAALWLLPNPSGLAAHYPRAEDLATAFVPLAQAALSDDRSTPSPDR
jgi:double-stranded uracil-DNA glycosylase